MNTETNEAVEDLGTQRHPAIAVHTIGTLAKAMGMTDPTIANVVCDEGSPNPRPGILLYQEGFKTGLVVDGMEMTSEDEPDEQIITAT